MKEVAASDRIVRFGAFEVDFRNGDVRKHGLRIRLQSQPFHVLQVLLEHPGELVTREQLQRQIWPADTFVDFEKGLNNAVKKLRDALGDSADQPRYIETHSRRGYRFIAPIKVDSAQNDSALPVTRESVAVLPFVNMSPDPESEFFADGITEEIINALSQIDQLHVAARTSSFFFKNKRAEIREIAEQLNVRTLLEGSVRRSGNHLRITAQLVNAADGYHLWSERYDREMKHIFELQDEIARSIAGKLKVGLEGVTQGSLIRAGTENLEAYQLYLKGRALLYRRGAGLARALECFHLALALDPEYALAWADVADAYVMLAFYGPVRPDTVQAKAMEAALRAVSLDETVAEAHNALAAAHVLNDCEGYKAEREFLRALELNPRLMLARVRYALWSLSAAGRFEEGISQAKQALDLDPLSDYAATILSFTYYVAGRLTQALEMAQRAMELEPESFLARIGLAFVLHSQGRYTETLAITQAGLAISGRHPMFMAMLAVTYAEWHKPADAKSVHAELLARSVREYVSPFLLAVSASACGDQDEAIEFLGKACEIHDLQLRIFGKHWPGSHRLREDPRFEAIVAGMGLK